MIRDRSQTLRPPQFSRTKSVGGVARAKTLGFRAKSQPVQRMRTFDASGMEEIVHDVVISPELFGNVLSYRILITCE